MSEKYTVKDFKLFADVARNSSLPLELDDAAPAFEYAASILREHEQNAGEAVVPNDGRVYACGKCGSEMEFKHYTHPAQAVSVPDAIQHLSKRDFESEGSYATRSSWERGWNACREAMLASAPTAPDGDGGSHEQP